jgi:hypothetical protein
MLDQVSARRVCGPGDRGLYVTRTLCRVANPPGFVGCAMDEKHRLSGFKALLESQKSNLHHLEEPDGSFRLWRNFSAEGRLEYIARDAAFYDVTFEQFAEAVRESVDSAAIEVAALRIVMRSVWELHDLEKLFRDDGRTESPPPLVERVSELLNAESPGHDSSAMLTPEEQQASLFKEILADTQAGKREDADRYGKKAAQDILGVKTKAPAAEKVKDRGIDK